jgi:hypothetical protein
MSKSKGNNTAGRIKEVNYKTLTGQIIRPVLYAGNAVGHGKYMAGMIGDKLILDQNNIPIPYSKIS